MAHLTLKMRDFGLTAIPSGPVHVSLGAESDGRVVVMDSSGAVTAAFTVDLLLGESPTPAEEAGKVKLYAKRVNGALELFVLDDGVPTDIQITNNGAVSGGSGSIFFASSTATPYSLNAPASTTTNYSTGVILDPPAGESVIYLAQMIGSLEAAGLVLSGTAYALLAFTAVPGTPDIRFLAADVEPTAFITSMTVLPTGELVFVLTAGPDDLYVDGRFLLAPVIVTPFPIA